MLLALVVDVVVLLDEMGFRSDVVGRMGLRWLVSSCWMGLAGALVHVPCSAGSSVYYITTFP
jgi:hypothetical protein